LGTHLERHHRCKDRAHDLVRTLFVLRPPYEAWPSLVRAHDLDAKDDAGAPRNTACRPASPARTSPHRPPAAAEVQVPPPPRPRAASVLPKKHRCRLARRDAYSGRFTPADDPPADRLTHTHTPPPPPPPPPPKHPTQKTTQHQTTIQNTNISPPN